MQHWHWTLPRQYGFIITSNRVSNQRRHLAMPPHLDDHIPVPVTNAVVLTAAQFNDLQAFLAELHAKRDQQPANALNDEQFADLRKLLQPGAELSALMLADYKAQHAE